LHCLAQRNHTQTVPNVDVTACFICNETGVPAQPAVEASSGSSYRIRFYVDFSPKCSIGPITTDLLEAIAAVGTIRGAARRAGVSCRGAVVRLNRGEGSRSISNQEELPQAHALEPPPVGDRATICGNSRMLLREASDP
jgi:hypothetical protein